METLPEQLIEYVCIDYINDLPLDKKYEKLLKCKKKYVINMIEKKTNICKNELLKWIHKKKGNLNIIKWFLYKKNKTVLEYNGTVFLIACKYGCLDMIKLLWKIRNEYPLYVLYEEDYGRSLEGSEYGNMLESPLYYASVNGKLNVIKWLWIHRNEIQFRYNEYTLKGACKNGHLHVVEWFWKRRDEIPLAYNGKNIKELIFEALEDASAAGHLSVLEWFWENRTEIQFKQIELHKTIINGKINVIKWFFERKNFFDLSRFGSYSVLEAVREGYYNIFAWYWENKNDIELSIDFNNNFTYKESQEYPEKYFKWILQIACISGNEKILNHCFEKNIEFKLKYSNVMFDYAIEYRNLKTIEYLWKLKKEIPFIEYYNKNSKKILEKMIHYDNDNFDIDDWFWERRNEISLNYRKDVINLTNEIYNFDSIKWFWERRYEISIFSMNKIDFDYLCETAARYGHLNVIEWFWERRYEISIFSMNKIDFDYLCETAARYGHLNVIEWFWERRNEIPFIIINKTNFDNLVDIAGVGGHLNIIEWFWKRRNEIPFKYSSNAVDLSCRFSCNSIKDWFWEKRKEIKFKYTKNAIDLASKNGNLDTIKWFWARRDEIPFKYTKEAPKLANKYGNSKILEWFVKNCNETIY